VKRLALALLVLAIGVGGVAAGIAYTRSYGQPVAMFANSHTRPWILPLNNPSVVPTAEASHMRPDDLVFGIIAEGRARAYPQWIITNYHLANDTVGGLPLYLAHCEICSGAAAFATGIEEIGHSRIRPRRWVVAEATSGVIQSMTFRTCGMRAGTIEICDDQTQSRWHPFTGRCRAGYLEGFALRRIPVFAETWSEWSGRFPDGEVVLASAETRRREHGASTPPGIGSALTFPGFDAISQHQDPRLPSNALIFGIALPDGRAVAVTLDFLEKHRSRLRYDVGGSSFLVYKRSGYGVVALGLTPKQAEGEFAIVREQPFRIGDRAGSLWNEAGEPVAGGTQRLLPVDGYLTEWYEWIQTYPETILLDREAS
jgi:hypothetical protein